MADTANHFMTDSRSTVLEVDGLAKHFPVTGGFFSTVSGYVYAVDGGAFSIHAGETLGLVGESGSGKTTVGRCVLRLIEPTEGRVTLDGEDVTKLDSTRLRDLRANMQLVFQDPFGSLNPRLTVSQTVEEPLKLHGMVRVERHERVAEMMRLVGLSEHFYNYYPADLTASEQQRVGIARALATKP